MKKTLAVAALALTGLLAAPSKADAGLEIRIGTGTRYDPHAGHGHGYGYSQTIINGHASCGCPVYVKRVFRGRDCYGRPIFDLVRIPFVCGGHHRAETRYSQDRRPFPIYDYHASRNSRDRPPLAAPPRYERGYRSGR